MCPSPSDGTHVILSEAKDPGLDAPRSSPGSLVAALLGMTQSEAT